MGILLILYSFLTSDKVGVPLDKKKLFSILAALIGMFAILLIADLKPLEKKKEVPHKVVNEIVTPDKQNELTANSFIQELLGTDYQFLIYLFEPSKLTRNTDNMSETEMASYAKEVGNKIKEGKTLVKGQITNIKKNGQVYQYTVLLSFSDGSQKQIQIDIKEG